MTDERTSPEPGSRQSAIEAYDSRRQRVSDTLGEAPLIALTGGLAAGAPAPYPGGDESRSTDRAPGQAKRARRL